MKSQYSQTLTFILMSFWAFSSLQELNLQPMRQLDISSALPTAEMPRGFSSYRVSRNMAEQPNSGLIEVRAHRVRDDLYVTVQVCVMPDETAALEWAKGITYPPGGRMPRGCPSGRKIGQEVWQSRYRNGGPPRGSFGLITRDGRSVVMVDLMYTVKAVRGGAPVQRVFSREDLLMTERLALGCLNRLTQMGYTSRSVKKPSN
jgi:hypothetical protein